MTELLVRRRLAELIDEATEGGVGAADALDGAASLTALGVDSLGLLRLIDAIEAEFGVEIDLGDSPRLGTLDGIVDHLARHGAA
jgi:acyl carrier protein